MSHLNSSCDNEYLVNYLTALEERLAILEGNRVQEPVVVKVSPQTLADSYRQLDSDAQDEFLARIGAKLLKKKKAQGKKSTKKRTKSAYQLFSDAYRAEVDAQLRDASETGKLPRGAVMKELGAMRKKVSQEDKKPFQEEAARLKAEAATEQPTETVQGDSADEFVVAPKNAQSDDKKTTKKKTKKKTTDKKKAKKKTQQVTSNGDESEDDFGDFPDQFGESGEDDNLTDNEESD